MNSLRGKIISVTTHGKLSIVNISLGEISLKSIIIETPDTVPYLHEGNKINVLFKETEVIIGKGTEFPISLRNRIPCTVIRIENGVLLSKLILQSPSGEIRSLITRDAVDQMEIKNNDQVMAMIKTNEIMLSE